MPLRPCTRARSKPYRITVDRGSYRFHFWWRGKWRGVSLPVLEMWSTRGRVSLVSSNRGFFMPAKPVVKLGVEAGAKHGPWAVDLAVLAGWLCDAAYPDGLPVGQVQLQLKREGSVIRSTLKIEDQGGLRCSAVGESPVEALACLDLLLGSSACPWERDAYPLGSKGAKKK